MAARHKKILFWLMIVMGALLRFHGLDRQSLWDDEVATLQTIHTPWSHLLERHGTYESHPPLYFLQLRLWEKIVGGSLRALRANSAWWGTLALFLIYILAERYSLGLLSLGLITFSPLHMAYSQEIRPYAFGVCLALASWLAIERAAWPVAALLWTALFYTHYWGAFVVLAGALYGWVHAQTATQKKHVMMAALLATGLFLFWLPILKMQLRIVNGLAFWVPPPSFFNLGKTLVAYTGLFFKVASSEFRTPGPLALLVLVGAIHLCVAGWGWIRGPKFARYWLSVGLLTPWIGSYASHGLYLWYRYPIFIFPAFVILLAAGLSHLRWPALRGIFIGLLLGLQGVGLWHYFSGWQKANPKTVMTFIETYAHPNTVVVRPAYFAFLYNYYDEGRTRAINTDQLDSKEKRAALKGKTIFLITFDGASDAIGAAFLTEYQVQARRQYPGYAHLGITLYILK